MIDPIRSRAADHGPTCAETPIDHACGATEMDQGETWQQHSIRQEVMKVALHQRLNAAHQELKDIEAIMAEQCQRATPENAATRGWLNELRGTIARMEGRQ